jgi:hypothetical protein
MADDIRKLLGHDSHGLGPVREGHHVPGNLARDGAPKRVHTVAVHGGMSKATKSGALALGGHHASALDSLSGNVVVPGAIQDWPYSGKVTSNGHPLAKAPASKNLKAVAPSFGQRSRTKPHSAELGEAIMQQAFAGSCSDDCQAHGRKPDGSK